VQINEGMAVVIAAVITVAAGPFVNLGIQEFKRRRNLQALRGDLALIAGVWKGAIYLEHPGAKVQSSELRIEFSGPRTVKGGGYVVAPDGERIGLRFIGGVKYSRFLMLNYEAADSKKLQFGSTLLRLDGTGDSLDGRYLGYGSIHNSVVFGRVELKRQ